MSRYLGIDLGTSATKALVLDDDGRVLGKGRAGYPVTHPRVGWSEQDPRAWWTAVCSASRQALERAGPGALGAVALSGQLNGLVLLDEHHQPVADALIWLDQRATEEADILNARYPELLRAATLNPANPIYVGAKLLWVRRHRPELLERGRHLLLAKDYINLRLTGELATDTSDASCTLLYDLRTDAWIPELLEASRFDAGRLPPLFRSTDVIGRVRRDAAEVTGIPAGTPVMAGAGDVTALSVGSGAVDEHVVSVTLGTAGHVVAASTALTPDGYQRIWQMRHAVQDRYLRLGLVMSGGLSLATPAPAPTACCSSPSWRALRPPSRSPTFGRPSWTWPPRTPRATWCRRCSKGWPTTCATAWRCSRSSGATLARSASARAAAAAMPGARSSPTCSRSP
jgi:xylulokinase